MQDKSNCAVICTLLRSSFFGSGMNVERMFIPLTIHRFPNTPHVLCVFYLVLLLFLLWTVLLAPHLDLWFWPMSDGWHEQPLNKVVEAHVLNIFVQFLFPTHHGTSIHNTPSISLQRQSDFRQSLTGYIADVAETFESMIWLFGRGAWNFPMHLLLLVPRTFSSWCCLSNLSFFCTSAFSCWYSFLSLPFASLFSLIAACHTTWQTGFLEVPDKVNNWLVDFFEGHSHCTKFEQHISSTAKVTASIVQGSAVGPVAYMYVVNASDIRCNVLKWTSNICRWHLHCRTCQR